MRRLLDLSTHCGMKFSQVIKFAESQASYVESDPVYPFLRAYIPQRIRTTKHWVKIFEILRECIFDLDPSDGFFYKALAITFEERGLNFEFWRNFPDLTLEEESDGEY